MVGTGMIFDETYRPMFEALHANGLYRRDLGAVDVVLAAVASRTGTRARRYKDQAAGRIADFTSFEGAGAVTDLLRSGTDFVCVATPDHRHFDIAKATLAAGCHVLIEKPSVLTLQQLDELVALAAEKHVLAKVVYHKLCDPDHKKLRTLVHDGELRHVNNGYCSLLEPKSIATGQFAEWIQGRNPGTYVAVHYIKLIDFTFGPAWKLTRVTATGQRGLVGPAAGHARREPQPTRKLTGAMKTVDVRHTGDEGRCRQQTDAGDLHQPLNDRILFGHRSQLAFDGLDAGLEIPNLSHKQRKGAA
jgi:predicted dehydrogenase